MMSTKRRFYIIFSWLLVIVMMSIIFCMSSDSASESSGKSNSVIAYISEFIGIELSSFVIRKAAHMTEFAFLAILLFNAVKASFPIKNVSLTAWGIASVYGIFDEIHQIFVNGRACQIRDMFIDSAGALTGIVAAVLVLKVINIISERRKRNGNT